MHLVTLGVDDDELAALFEMMRVTGCATPAAVVKQALWKQARFLEVDVAADAFAGYRTAGERATRRRVRRATAVAVPPGASASAEGPPPDPPAPARPADSAPSGSASAASRVPD